MDKMEDELDDPEAFCASLKDEYLGREDWREESINRSKTDMKLTEFKLRQVIREETRQLLGEQEVVIKSGTLVDGVEFVSRKQFERHYSVNPPSTEKYMESFKALLKADGDMHRLFGHLMDHDAYDHELPDRVPDRDMLPTHEEMAAHIQNIEQSDQEGDVGESFRLLQERVYRANARVHSIMAQHVQHHVDMGANDDITNET
jgi:hypothetical protein